MKNLTEENNALFPIDENDLDNTAIESENVSDYYSLPEKRPSIIWSLLSLIFSIFSVLLSPIYYIGLPMAIFSVVMALISSKKLGYFNKMSLVGLVIGIFGTVFGIFVLALDVTGVLDGLLNN